MPGIDASVLRVTAVLKYAFHVWSGFGLLTCAIGGVTLGALGLLDALVMTRMQSNRCSRSVNGVDLRL